MAELTTIARPYAEAVFKNAKQADTINQWSEGLQFLAQIAQDSELKAIINHPKIDSQKTLGLILDICDDHIHTEAKNLVKLLVENNKFSILPTISTLFEQHKAEDQGYVNVELYSAYPLTKAEQTKYSAMLEKQLHKKVNAVVTVDKSLIGGILAVAGDKVLDGSIRGQIQQLAKRL